MENHDQAYYTWRDAGVKWWQLSARSSFLSKISFPSLVMSKWDRRHTVYVVVSAAIFLYLQVFILPALAVLLSDDQTVYNLDGRRILEGQVLYRDFFQFLFPGTEFVYFALFKLFGVRAWVPNAALVLLGVGFVWTSLIISRRLLRGASIILPGFLFLAIPFRNAMGAGSHHWYSTLAVMTALAVLIDKRSPGRLVAAGALCGLGTWFNQTRGPAGLLGFAIFLLWERYQTKETWRSLLGRVVPLIGSFLLTLVALSSYFVLKAGLNHFFFSTVVFLLKYSPQYPPMRWDVYGADMPFPETWHSTVPLGRWLVVELLVPWVYFLFFLRARRERKMRPQESWDRLMLVSIVGLCLFLSVAPSALNYRLCTVSLPAFILLVWFAKWPGRIERAALPFFWVGLLALMIAETHSIQTRGHATLDLPVGRVATFHRDIPELFRWYLSHTRPSDYLFAAPYLNFALGLRNPTPIDFLTTSDYTRPEQVQRVVEALETKRARWVEWEPDVDLPEGQGNHLGPLRSYLHAHYHLATTFYDGSLQVWERSE
jgi:hypothetical protein